MTKQIQDAYIVAATRLPVAKRNGMYKHVRPDDMLAYVIKSVVAQVPGIDPARIGDVIVGCAMPEAEQGMNVARIGLLLAGLPITVPGITINRFCSSGVQAIALAADRIRTGDDDVVIAAGTESMSMVPMMGNKVALNSAVFAKDENTMAALAVQTVPVEVVLVDCASTDGTRALAETPPAGVPRRDAYLIRAYEYPEEWEGLPAAELERRLAGLRGAQIRRELRTEGQRVVRDGGRNRYNANFLNYIGGFLAQTCASVQHAPATAQQPGTIFIRCAGWDQVSWDFWIVAQRPGGICQRYCISVLPSWPVRHSRERGGPLAEPARIRMR